MVTRKARLLAAAFFAAAVVKGGEVQKTAVYVSFDAATIASNGVKVADWMLAHPKRANHRDWSYGAFYAGLEEFARATGERRYIDAIREEGRTYGWKFEKRDADVGNTHCIGQAWLDIARAERDDAVVASVRAELDAFMAAHVDAPLARREGERVVLNRRRWYWCDALFMSPPVWAKLAAITGERKYLDFMMGEYRATYDHLYDREDHLFWRDARYVGRTTPNGKKLFWGRGNGWVLAGLPFVIRELPTDSAERRWFTALFKEMCAKVRTIQRADGAWSASLLDGKNPDAPEMSATAFFCYALAWGVNNGVLDEATYLPCVERAWAAMCRCVGDDGKFGWVQPIGESPVKNFGPDSTETYGAGGYLLAATELRRYALAHVSRVDQIAARLPERPCTPAQGRAALPDGRGTRPACPLPVRSVFPQSQVYLMRPGGGKGGIALGVKGGHNAELHNHNDVGSYAISLGGEVLCGDVGGELYSRRTFSSRRYDSEVLNSFGHPVPRPGVLQGLGRRYAARIIRTEFRPNRDTVVFDLTGAYPSKTLKRLHRKFIYDRAAQTVTIRDEVDFKEPTAFDDPLATLVGVDGRAATAGVTTSVRQQGTGLVFVGKKGRLAVDVETSGGEWEWDVRTMDNGRGELPVTKDAPEGKWAIWVAGKTQNTPPDGRPRRIAVKFKKPVMSAMVEFHFRAVDTNIPEPENVPELMRTFAGEEVKTKEAWEKVRAPELLERFQKDVYGRRPAVLDERKRVSFKVYDERSVMDGKAIRKLVRAEFDGPLGKFSFPFTVYMPKAQKPVPAFVSICLKSRSKVGADHVITSVCWPVEQIVGRGYATIGFLTEDIATEKNTGFAQGVFTCVEKPEARTDESWGTISAWAWAASRVMDWIETEPAIDATRVGIVGHSRGGKTAIWTGVTDRRFALVCSNNSGAHGAKLNHIRLPKSEDIASIPKYFPNWYCGNYPKKYGGKEMSMDFDQHELLALVAPRLLCVASASEDAWAGQPGEWWSAKLASPAWELYGKKGLVAERFPAPGEKQQGGSVSYHLRPGKHSLDPYDWDRYMDFADKNL